MEKMKQTADEFFRAIIVVYYGLLIGQVIFGLLTVYLINYIQISPEGNDLKDVFLYIVPFFVVGGVIASYLVFNNRLKAIDPGCGLTLKLTEYRSALIVRYALLEGPSLFCIVTYLVTGYIVFILLAAFIIFIFLTIKPSRERAIRDLKPNADEEKAILGDRQF